VRESSLLGSILHSVLASSTLAATTLTTVPSLSLGRVVAERESPAAYETCVGRGTHLRQGRKKSTGVLYYRTVVE